MISVDAVIADQFPALDCGSPLLRRPLVAFLKYLFHEREFLSFAEHYPHLRGFAFIDQVLDYFDFDYRVRDRQRERIPVSGRVVIVSNHPIGSLDGLALMKLVGEIRRDVKAVANDILLALEPLQELLLPVDAMNQRSGRAQLRAIEDHLEAGGAVVIFPAGEVSRFGARGVRDGHWRNGFIRFARKTDSAILPVHIDGRNSLFFYALSLLAKPLSTLWLVREMFKQARRTVDIHIGHPVSPRVYTALPLDMNGLARLFRRHVYGLARQGGDARFRDVPVAVAHPENRQRLRQEIRACEALGTTHDNKQICLYRHCGDSAILRELGRLREESFRAVGEGSGKRRDLDPYDSHYEHILLWDDEELEIAGAYRLAQTAQLITSGGRDALYTGTLFDYQPGSRHYLAQGLELGRSFVQPRYWGNRSLDYLWQGIGAYLARAPQLRYLLGPVSLSNDYPTEAKDLLVSFYSHFFPPAGHWARPRRPYIPYQLPQWGDDYRAALAELKKRLEVLGCTIPTLYKQYAEIADAPGVQFAAFNIDTDFANCIDALVLVDLEYLKPRARKRYLGDTAARASIQESESLTPTPCG